MEWCCFLFLFGLCCREDILSSIFDTTVPLQSWKMALDNLCLLLQVSMQLSNPMRISSLALAHEKGNGSRYLGPLAIRSLSLESDTIFKSPVTICL